MDRESEGACYCPDVTPMDRVTGVEREGCGEGKPSDQLEPAPMPFQKQQVIAITLKDGGFTHTH